MTLASEQWQITKPPVSGRNGIVASQHYLASEVGADILRKGGNAVDAAIGTGLALGCVEPWASGIGGGGYMVIYRRDRQETKVVEFGMRAPFDSITEDYPLAASAATTDAATFNWPAVEGHVNAIGPLSVAVPGYIKGVSLALAEFGTMRWADVIAPACDIAARGLPIDWSMSYRIHAQARSLNQYAETQRVYLKDGFAPVAGGEGGFSFVPLGELGNTFAKLRDTGPDDYYTGEIAQNIVADLGQLGSRISLKDLADYSASIVDPLSYSYRDATVTVAGNLTAGPSIKQAMSFLSNTTFESGPLREAEVYGYVEALRKTYDYRLKHLGEGAGPKPNGSTSHLVAMDTQGNIVSLTQTIMSSFGSHIMSPRTGILFNNGMMWFDPRPGGPNSVVGGRRPLCNMCPTILHLADGTKVGLGACGGRKIFPSVFQLSSFLIDKAYDLHTAVHSPRVDVSGNENVWCMSPHAGRYSGISKKNLRDTQGTDERLRGQSICHPTGCTAGF